MRRSAIRNTWHRYRASAVAQAVAKNVAWLAALVALDAMLRLPPAGRMLYVLPVFGLSRVAGVRWGVALAVVATIVGTILDRTAHFGDAWLLNAIVRFTAYAVVAFKVDGMVDRLKVTSDAARHDALTGALNRLGFVQAAEGILGDALVDDGEAVLAVIDLDDFKMANDLYGHAYGDKMLKTLVDCLSPAIAGGGLIARTGGDEFQVLFTGEPKTSVQQAIGRALNRFSDSTLVLGHRSTFSYGIAALRTDGTTLEPLLQCADARMYRQKAAKRKGAPEGRYALVTEFRRAQSA
ncbi:MAG: GGDEF domain-containing protein [Fimbriimonadaceae bacterium]